MAHGLCLKSRDVELISGISTVKKEVCTGERNVTVAFSISHLVFTMFSVDWLQFVLHDFWEGQKLDTWSCQHSWYRAQEHAPDLDFPGSDQGSAIFQSLLLLLGRFSRVQLCATPETAAHQAPPSLGFSRQEHWSGLPFPSPVHESKKWKWSRSVVSDS